MPEYLLEDDFSSLHGCREPEENYQLACLGEMIKGCLDCGIILQDLEVGDEI